MPEPTELTLDQYVARLQAEITAFADKWRAHNALDPDHWPATMGIGEWDEQFIAETM
ncbi:hypothetical protein KABACHOK_05010 [Brevundimonas phage vB_BpoS-Kabachok]|uniref:Uncharacterized protein n=1 Tax=Brevundimonas phage vB_BpoS-Kabachok TaxID=2948600 RepID=A0A9E7MQN8_9CAUD|nr:hypothetical protein KABACHOK_05010 [Brevundimonas phage vB_BpoS-Kabachok]